VKRVRQYKGKTGAVVVILAEGDMVIRAQNLYKRFGNFTAVAGVDFYVRRGECFGLLGPNGAGKTSIVRMICGQSPVTAGELTVFGQEVAKKARQIKARIGVVPQEDNLDPELTVWENLMVYAAYFRTRKEEAGQRAREILAFMELEEKAETVVEELSGGLKRRLAIGRALINRPQLLVLDEPTTGLDPYARRLIWQRVRQLAAAGTTVLLTTHYMEEASQLCDRLVIIHRGRIVEEGAPGDLVLKHAGREALELEVPPSEHGEMVRAGGELVKGWLSLGERLVLFTERGRELYRRLNDDGGRWSARPGWKWLRSSSLEDVFLKLTGETLEN